jgi:hypothetical protein
MNPSSSRKRRKQVFKKSSDEEFITYNSNPLSNNSALAYSTSLNQMHGNHQSTGGASVSSVASSSSSSPNFASSQYPNENTNINNNSLQSTSHLSNFSNSLSINNNSVGNTKQNKDKIKTFKSPSSINPTVPNQHYSNNPQQQSSNYKVYSCKNQQAQHFNTQSNQFHSYSKFASPYTNPLKSNAYSRMHMDYYDDNNRMKDEDSALLINDDSDEEAELIQNKDKNQLEALVDDNENISKEDLVSDNLLKKKVSRPENSRVTMSPSALSSTSSSSSVLSATSNESYKKQKLNENENESSKQLQQMQIAKNTNNENDSDNECLDDESVKMLSKG